MLQGSLGREPGTGTWTWKAAGATGSGNRDAGSHWKDFQVPVPDSSRGPLWDWRGPRQPDVVPEPQLRCITAQHSAALVNSQLFAGFARLIADLMFPISRSCHGLRRCARPNSGKGHSIEFGRKAFALQGLMQQGGLVHVMGLTGHDLSLTYSVVPFMC